MSLLASCALLLTGGVLTGCASGPSEHEVANTLEAAFILELGAEGTAKLPDDFFDKIAHQIVETCDDELVWGVFLSKFETEQPQVYDIFDAVREDACNS